MGKYWSWSSSRLYPRSNDLPDNLSTNVKLFADDILLFFVVHDITTSSCVLNYDLNRVREWAFQWKMSFNPEPSKPAEEVIFTRKLQKKNYPPPPLPPPSTIIF